VEGRFVEGHFMEGRFVEGHFMEGRFVEGHFVLAAQYILYRISCSTYAQHGTHCTGVVQEYKYKTDHIIKHQVQYSCTGTR
jgi:hypothetical protein